MDETWKKIPGWENFYEVSNQGNIRRTASGPGAQSGHILKPSAVRDGYLMVRLCRKGYQRSYQVHRLVLLAFVGPLPSNKEVNHKNGIRTDNRVVNLEYLTRSENLIHSYRNLGRPVLFGSRSPAAKLTEADIELIRLHLLSGLSYTNIAREFKVTKGTIAHIAQGRTWRGGKNANRGFD